jgi:hypothetical protein
VAVGGAVGRRARVVAAAVAVAEAKMVVMMKMKMQVELAAKGGCLLGRGVVGSCCLREGDDAARWWPNRTARRHHFNCHPPAISTRL